jgi:PPOX class probable F420-dependent enzyme
MKNESEAAVRSFDPAAERYVSLATFRRNGREIRTPVWLAELDGRYYLFSEGSAGKVKRIRANGRARMAACDFRGRVKSDWLEARGRSVEEAGLVERVYAALRGKYGLSMKIGDFFSKLTGRYDKRAIIELEVSGTQAMRRNSQ